MGIPNLGGMIASKRFLVMGHSWECSHEFLRQSVSRLLVRAHMADGNGIDSEKDRSMHNTATTPTRTTTTTTSTRGNVRPSLRMSRETPIPVGIQRRLIKSGVPSLEVMWRVESTVTDSNGTAIDGYEFTTVESFRSMMSRYRDIVAEFEAREKDREKQGNTEQQRRQEFLQSLFGSDTNTSSATTTTAAAAMAATTATAATKATTKTTAANRTSKGRKRGKRRTKQSRYFLERRSAQMVLPPGDNDGCAGEDERCLGIDTDGGVVVEAVEPNEVVDTVDCVDDTAPVGSEAGATEGLPDGGPYEMVCTMGDFDIVLSPVRRLGRARYRSCCV